MNGKADSLLRAEYGITHSQFVFLLCVHDSGPIDVTRLAEQLGVTKGAVSKRLAWFVEKNLAVTSQRPGDSKRVFVDLTSKGKKIAAKSVDFLESRFLATLSKNPNVDYKALSAEIMKIFDLLRASD